MIELTPFQAQTLVLVVATVGTMATGLLVHHWLIERREQHGWARAANQLVAKQRALRAKVDQLEDHVGHLAAELERTRAQVAARPPSDPTVRLGISPGRTSRLAAVDPWPTTNGSNR